MDDNFYLNFTKTLPQQKQNKQPGTELEMNPKPVSENPEYRGSDKLKDKTVLITGGDSGIGKAVSIAFAKEGADLAIIYYNEQEDADNTKKIIETIGRKCTLIPGDVSDSDFCKTAVEKAIKAYNKIDVLVNNAAVQFPQNSIEDITDEQLEKTFRTNIFSMFYITRSVLPHLKPGCCIINTASITAYRGNEELIDYSSTKGAIVSFTRSLALSLIGSNIRVNAVAPGPIWTPLIPSSYSPQKVGEFGSNTPIGRPGQPVELASAYVFLASPEASYITGETIHVNGGGFIGG
ncbi:SDR family oxidoreductase [Clostridium luticellarii]|jgi:NAD(P)-dependent dehydrogenase (short-subunit alcohol dehydrogenase family)|uniref:General stress protein 39 n=1 Tax=Clostridium luticellarii TaxID=1691940 RepID=A0A2T0BSL3_9CLOT|nr:SDR family oxidoreductase [Clostridium luticellarii]MCI1945759.1 SDR family oxidoreductase [Clostridium luticellarii]MCI1968489.1 SDR family oxidoreductase [Clostridium luticellarii]MCI1996017.1 SDR family oxidoreductase [Clostridium luticellarii]MCI2039883.1 SDR family oxidoreductase [Clostridium luticellarii]PRR86881.1 General stress protein 39 [Clostridium luticellarii]